MTTAAQILQSAYREGNLIPVGETATAVEDTEALSRLNRFVRGLYGTVMGEYLRDWLVPAPQRTAPEAANYPQWPSKCDPTSYVWPYPPANSRIILGGEEPQHVYFPEAPEDGARIGVVCGAGAVAGISLTLDGNGRTIKGAAQQLLTAPFSPSRWLYRADLGDWRPIMELALTDEMPFPEDMDDLFVTGLAIRLNPAYDKTTTVETQLTYKTMMQAFRARYKQKEVTVFGSDDYPRSLQSYASGRWWY